ncbi:SMC family ATPase, partial [Geodermatophilus sp. CPCC 205506]
AADAAARSARVDAELAAARALADRHARRDRARQDLDRLTAQEAQLVPLRARADAGRRAEVLRDVLETAGRTALAAEQAAAALADARAAWAEVGEHADADTVRARELRDSAAAARALVPEADRAGTLARDLAALQGDVEALTTRCAQGARAAEGWPERVATAQARLDAALAAAATVPGLTAAEEGARAALDAATRAEQVAARVASARTAAEQARLGWLEAREQLVELRAARLDGMAAELAAGLADGTDCPVCGSAAHPRPAVPTGRAVSADDEERARAAADAAEARASSARQAVDERERELAVLRARAGDLPPEQLAARAAGTRAELTAATRLAGSAAA